MTSGPPGTCGDDAAGPRHPAGETSTRPQAAALAVEIAAVRAEHARADGKAALLSAPAGVAVSVLAAGHRGPLAVLAAAVWSVCGMLALAAVWPRLRRRGTRSGFPAYAAATAGTVLAWLARPDGDQATAAYLVSLSRLAVTKYRLVQAATAAAAVALALTAGALA